MITIIKNLSGENTINIKKKNLSLDFIIIFNLLTFVIFPNTHNQHTIIRLGSWILVI